MKYYHRKNNYLPFFTPKQDDKLKMTYKPQDSLSYPFGKNLWIVEENFCGLYRGNKINMSLSVCNEDQFTCFDGSCISLQKRCDLRTDCRDHSDETDCSHVDFPSSYKKSIPPPPPEGSKVLEIKFKLEILSFPSIKTQDLTFDTTFKLILQWQDLRLSYKNLKDGKTINILSNSEVQKIWTPKIWFQNAFGNTFNNLEEGSRVECLSFGKPKPGPITVAEQSKSQL